MMRSTHLLLVWSVFFASTFDLVLAAGNLKGVQHFQDDGHTTRQLETVPMEDGNERTMDNEEERQVAAGLGAKAKSFVTSFIHSPHTEEQSTLRLAEDVSQHVKVKEGNLENAKTAGIVAKEESVGYTEAYYDNDFKLEVAGLAIAVIGMVAGMIIVPYQMLHPK